MEIVMQWIILGFSAYMVILSGGSYTAFLGLLCCAALCFISVRTRYRREKRLEELILYLMKLQDNLELPEMTKYSEGQLGVLQSELYKLVVQNQEKSAGALRKRSTLRRCFRISPIRSRRP